MRGLSEDTQEDIPAARAAGCTEDVDHCCDAAIRAAADAADKRLVREISAGSRSALGRLHSVYFVRLAKFFAYLLPSSLPQVQDDLIADTLFDVWRASADLGSDCSVHVGIMRLAWAHARRCLAGGEAHLVSTEPHFHDGEGERYCTDQAVAVRLPPKDPGAGPWSERAVIHLVYAGNSRQEVADILGLPGEFVDAHLSGWRRALSESIAIQCNDH
jgi:DNA-directed RNA polymerase specialized sigma24 family protein